MSEHDEGAQSEAVIKATNLLFEADQKAGNRERARYLANTLAMLGDKDVLEEVLYLLLKREEAS
jgi:hypothetical protein